MHDFPTAEEARKASQSTLSATTQKALAELRKKIDQANAQGKFEIRVSSIETSVRKILQELGYKVEYHSSDLQDQRDTAYYTIHF